MPRYALACCVIYRDEASYLSEWLRFHERAGVEHFFLYDNESRDAHRDVIAGTLPPERFTLVDWPGVGVQRSAYQHCLENFGADCRWLAFIDVDEFLFSPTGRPLTQELEDFTEVPAVAVSAFLFGSSGYEARPPGLVTQSYLWRAKETTAYPFRERLRRPDADPNELASYYPMSAHVKCIVDPARTLRCEGPHRLLYAGGALAVTEEKEPVPRNYALRVSMNRFRIHHYWTRSQEEFRAKLARGRVSGRPKYDESVAFAVEALMHEVHDATLRDALSGVPLYQPGGSTQP